MFCHDFIRYFEDQNPGQSWNVIEKRIFKMLKELFEAVVDGKPPAYLAESCQSRAMYAVDLMLQWTDDILGNSWFLGNFYWRWLCFQNYNQTFTY